MNINKNLVAVVDDKPILRNAICSRLELDGLNTCTANNGKECLKLVTEKNPRVIIMDLNMPEMGGMEAIKKMYDAGNLNESTVIVLSKDDSTENIQKAMDYGVVDFISKNNCDLEEVVEKVKANLY